MSSKYQPPSHRSEYRRKQYRDNANYRNRVRQNTRDRYRKEHAVYVPDARGGLSRIGEAGKVRLVRIGGGKRKMLTFTVAELAGLVGRTPENLQRWFGRNLLPAPFYRAVATSFCVYTRDEVRVILRILARHFEQTAYYRYDHIDTRTAIFAAVLNTRKGKGDGKKAS